MANGQFSNPYMKKHSAYLDVIDPTYGSMWEETYEGANWLDPPPSPGPLISPIDAYTYNMNQDIMSSIQDVFQFQDVGDWQPWGDHTEMLDAYGGQDAGTDAFRDWNTDASWSNIMNTMEPDIIEGDDGMYMSANIYSDPSGGYLPIGPLTSEGQQMGFHESAFTDEDLLFENPTSALPFVNVFDPSSIANVLSIMKNKIQSGSPYEASQVQALTPEMVAKTESKYYDPLVEHTREGAIYDKAQTLAQDVTGGFAGSGGQAAQRTQAERAYSDQIQNILKTILKSKSGATEDVLSRVMEWQELLGE